MATRRAPDRPAAATTRIPELVGDLGALIDASGAQQVHLVGHDWGAAVAWAAAAEMPERLKTVSPVSVPHPAAFLKSFLNSRQGLASWYMYFFQLPRVPEWSMKWRNGAMMSKLLQQAGQTPASAARDAQAMREPGALTAAINWYRAMPLSNPRAINQKVICANALRVERRGHRADAQIGPQHRPIRGR